VVADRDSSVARAWSERIARQIQIEATAIAAARRDNGA
jgi:hypothetical protein